MDGSSIVKMASRLLPDLPSQLDAKADRGAAKHALGAETAFFL